MAHQHDYIWMLAIFGKNSTSTNHNNLYIIWTQILQRFWIWSQKFNIPPVTPYMAISVCFRHISGEIGPPPIMLIYISSELNFRRDYESEGRNLKFHLWHSNVFEAGWMFPISLSNISDTVECFLQDILMFLMWWNVSYKSFWCLQGWLDVSYRSFRCFQHFQEWAHLMYSVS